MANVRVGILLLVLIGLTGCMYPQDERRQNQAPYEDQLQSVQSAVIQYQENNTGMLPIMTRDADTPIYRKYPINFSQLVPAYLEAPPGNSFENGGIYQYVIVNPEDYPEVKLIDLGTVRPIQDLERKISQYRSRNDYAPIAELMGNGLLKLDFEELGYQEEPLIESPFHPNHKLPILYQTDGTVVIDYTIDILHYVDEYGKESDQEDDLLSLLVENSPFVPVYSRPQEMEDGEVIFSEE
ncbi:hypothetical protein ACM26V_01515 [Salipaludibacillus sp. HK11]|uniref:hypothetical protein n=1 Tax=Salipaludibacillus sp. HK11 TaxID=3394320 RepID=UPI0039FC09FA